MVAGEVCRHADVRTESPFLSKSALPTPNTLRKAWQRLIDALVCSCGYMRIFCSWKQRCATEAFVLTFLTMSFVVTVSFRAEASAVSFESTAYKNYTEGLLFDKLGEYERASEAYRKAMKADSSAWDIHYRLGLDYLRLEDFKNAEREFLYVLKLKPHEERVRYFLALVYSFRLEYKKAADQFSVLLERPLLDLNEQSVRSSLAYLYLVQGSLKEAQEEYLAILKEDFRDSDAHFYVGFIYAESLEFDKAIEEFNKAIEFNANHAGALNSLSYIYAERAEQLDKALSLVQKALAIEPSNGAYLDTLGWVYFKKGDLENARRYLENASVFSKEAEIFDHLGDTYAALGMFEKAVKNWQAALDLSPKEKQIKDKLRQLKNSNGTRNRKN